MRKTILTLVAMLLVVGCRRQATEPNPSPTGSGIYEAHTWSNAGPGHWVDSATLVVKSDNGKELMRLTTDATGTVSTKLTAGYYRIQPLPESTDPAEHRVLIEADKTLHDTIIYCPMCL
jgi:hypothetical protein